VTARRKKTAAMAAVPVETAIPVRAPDDDGTLGPLAGPELSADELTARAAAEGDFGEAWKLHQEALKKRQTKLRNDARASYRAVEEWYGLPAEEAEQRWLNTCKDASKAYRSGRFLIERLGAERAMDPELMAVVWGLRQNLLADLGVTTTAESMAVDLAVLSYYNVLRIQGWIGNLALHIESEWFGLESPTAKFGKKWGRAEGLRVEDVARRFAEQLIPLLEKANKLTIRNLKAIQELKAGPLPNVNIHNPSQVNVGAVQQNVAEAAVPSAVSTPRRRARAVSPRMGAT